MGPEWGSTLRRPLHLAPLLSGGGADLRLCRLCWAPGRDPRGAARRLWAEDEGAVLRCCVVRGTPGWRFFSGCGGDSAGGRGRPAAEEGGRLILQEAPGFSSGALLFGASSLMAISP